MKSTSPAFIISSLRRARILDDGGIGGFQPPRAEAELGILLAHACELFGLLLVALLFAVALEPAVLADQRVGHENQRNQRERRAHEATGRALFGLGGGGLPSRRRRGRRAARGSSRGRGTGRLIGQGTCSKTPVAAMDKPIPPADTRCQLVLTTLPSRDAAQAIARTLVEERMAACVQIVDGLLSIYRWEGRIDESAECQLVAKTTPAAAPALDRAAADAASVRRSGDPQPGRDGKRRLRRVAAGRNARLTRPAAVNSHSQSPTPKPWKQVGSWTLDVDGLE